MMNCDNPFVGRGVPFGCGQCKSCRINRRRQWAARMILESTSHASNCFVTLTYDDAHYPSGGALEPRVVQLWLKRLRKAVHPETFRFFLVGEYGEESNRPHYHLCLFGVSPIALVPERDPLTRAICETWGRGFVKVDMFHSNRASYAARYVVKKMTRADDPRLEGRHPEFARMSRRPGLGHEAMLRLAAQINFNAGAQLVVEEVGDVPRQMRFEGRKVVFSRYLLEKLREAIGFTDEYIEQIKAATFAETHGELLTLLEAAILAQEPEWVPTMRGVYLKKTAGRRAQIAGRYDVRRSYEAL